MFSSVGVGLLGGIGVGILDYEGDDVHNIRLRDLIIASEKESGSIHVRLDPV